MPPEDFHLNKEGLAKMFIKRLMEETNTVESRAVLEEWNDAYGAAALVYELGRCTRKIATGGFKGSEFGVLLHSAFPCLIDIMSDKAGDHWSISIV